MKRADLLVALVLLAVVVAFLFCTPLAAFYAAANAQHGYLLAFVKFALLATFGEMLAARIRCGSYLPPQFGLLPRAVVCGDYRDNYQLLFQGLCTRRAASPYQSRADGCATSIRTGRPYPDARHYSLLH